MKNLVVITGAGMSAESGLATFRGAGGLWDNYPVMQVASDEGFARDPALIHRFYNKLRHDLLNCKPNAGHTGIAQLERYFNVNVITQNVDDLHERAGSTKVLHLHGELMKVRTMTPPYKIYTLPSDELSDKDLETSTETVNEQGEHVRPHIVFFGESVPEFEPAINIVQSADILVVIGTSLVVYPAAALINYAPSNAEVYYIDPAPAKVPSFVHVIPKKATEGVAELTKLLLK